MFFVSSKPLIWYKSREKSKSSNINNSRGLMQLNTFAWYSPCCLKHGEYISSYVSWWWHDSIIWRDIIWMFLWSLSHQNKWPHVTWCLKAIIDDIEGYTILLDHFHRQPIYIGDGCIEYKCMKLKRDDDVENIFHLFRI